jgi:hypothetical protein
MKGTFYFNSARLGKTELGYLSLDDARRIAANGHEIGSHTVDHLHLPELETDEATRQMCNDRAALWGLGFPVTSLAYPFGEHTSTTMTIARNCNFNSARSINDQPWTRSDSTTTFSPYSIHAYGQLTPQTALNDLKSAVLNAEATGGWAVFVTHRICSSVTDPTCTASNATDPALLDQFFAWLAPRVASETTVVKTVNAVVGGAALPAVQGPASPPVFQGNMLRNAGFEKDTIVTGEPDCWPIVNTDHSTASVKKTTDAHSGTYALEMDVSVTGNTRPHVAVQKDLGMCAPSVVPGATYAVAAWIKSTVDTQFLFYYRDKVGFWNMLSAKDAIGPVVSATPSAYTYNSWTFKAPADATAVSVGVGTTVPGTVKIDDISMRATP